MEERRYKHPQWKEELITREERCDWQTENGVGKKGWNIHTVQREEWRLLGEEHLRIYVFGLLGQEFIASLLPKGKQLYVVGEEDLCADLES